MDCTVKYSDVFCLVLTLCEWSLLEVQSKKKDYILNQPGQQSQYKWLGYELDDPGLKPKGGKKFLSSLKCLASYAVHTGGALSCG